MRLERLEPDWLSGSAAETLKPTVVSSSSLQAHFKAFFFSINVNVFVSRYSLPLFLLMCKVLTCIPLISLIFAGWQREDNIHSGSLVCRSLKKKLCETLENATGVLFFINWLFWWCHNCDQCWVSDLLPLLSACRYCQLPQCWPPFCRVFFFSFFLGDQLKILQNSL